MFSLSFNFLSFLWHLCSITHRSPSSHPLPVNKYMRRRIQTIFYAPWNKKKNVKCLGDVVLQFLKRIANQKLYPMDTTSENLNVLIKIKIGWKMSTTSSWQIKLWLYNIYLRASTVATQVHCVCVWMVIKRCAILIYKLTYFVIFLTVNALFCVITLVFRGYAAYLILVKWW